MRIAVVGATGIVGSMMLKVLEERHFPVAELVPVASKGPKRKRITFDGRTIRVFTLEDIRNDPFDVMLFSAGAEVSRAWIPVFTNDGARAIDNSSAFRMDEKVKLIVPEINAGIIDKSDMIIANPNCSTIQLLLVLYALEKEYGLERVIVSTYQSVSGSGRRAVEQMIRERRGRKPKMFYPHPIDMNCIPSCDDFLPDAYTKEEMKIVNESRKILNIPDLKITATAVRIPVLYGHGESVNIELKKEFRIADVKEILNHTQGVKLMDDPVNHVYPMPLNASGKDDVLVGRIRRDESREQALHVWIVADNIRKGAATNAVQILEYMHKNTLL
jgi:aspartate-semialdehyde dehydrogenase